jgi:hypothetical protein
MFFLLLPSKERTKEKSPQMQTFGFFCHTAFASGAKKPQVHTICGQPAYILFLVN